MLLNPLPKLHMFALTQLRMSMNGLRLPYEDTVDIQHAIITCQTVNELLYGTAQEQSLPGNNIKHYDNQRDGLRLDK